MRARRPSRGGPHDGRAIGAPRGGRAGDQPAGGLWRRACGRAGRMPLRGAKIGRHGRDQGAAARELGLPADPVAPARSAWASGGAGTLPLPWPPARPSIAAASAVGCPGAAAIAPAGCPFQPADAKHDVTGFMRQQTPTRFFAPGLSCLGCAMDAVQKPICADVFLIICTENQENISASTQLLIQAFAHL